MLGFFGPIANLVPHLGPQAQKTGQNGTHPVTYDLCDLEAPGILLPVRLCVVIRRPEDRKKKSAALLFLCTSQGLGFGDSRKRSGARVSGLSSSEADIGF